MESTIKTMGKTQYVNTTMENWSCSVYMEFKTKPKIVNVFSKIWNTKPEDLLVSFDGASFHMPPEITKKVGLEEKHGYIPTRVILEIIWNVYKVSNSK